MNDSMMLRESHGFSKYFDGIYGISLYPKLVRAEGKGDVHHSCVPSCEIDYKNCGWHNVIGGYLKWVYKVIPFEAGNEKFCVPAIGSMNAPSMRIILIMKC